MDATAMSNAPTDSVQDQSGRSFPLWATPLLPDFRFPISVPRTLYNLDFDSPVAAHQLSYRLQ